MSDKPPCGYTDIGLPMKIDGQMTKTKAVNKPMQNLATKKNNKKPIKNTNKTKSNKKINKGPYYPAWCLSVADPWNAGPAHIPDSATTSSGLCHSTIFFRGGATQFSTTSTSHSFGFFLPPIPYFTFLSSYNTSSDVTDIANAGTAYWNWSTGASISAPFAVPNINSILGTTNPGTMRSRIRCVGLSIQAIYEGTELQRAGKFIAALVPVTGQGQCIGTTGTVLSGIAAALGGTAGAVDFSIETIKQNAVKYTEQRITSAPFVARWLPAGAPTYQALASTPELYTTTAGVQPIVGAETFWSQPNGGPGLQAGQNALIFMVAGDTTSSTSLISNPYTFNIRWNWEVIPDEQYTVAYNLGKSVSNSVLLDSCLNSFQNLTVGIMAGNGSARA
jgi:hypothetical protein